MNDLQNVVTDEKILNQDWWVSRPRLALLHAKVGSCNRGNFVEFTSPLGGWSFSERDSAAMATGESNSQTNGG